MLAPCALFLEPLSASCCLTPPHLPGFTSSVTWIWAPGRNLSFCNLPSPPSTEVAGVLSVSLSLMGSELLKRSLASFMATAQCRAQASLGIGSQELLVKLDVTEAGSHISGFRHCLCLACSVSSPHSISQQATLTRPPGTWRR